MNKIASIVALSAMVAAGGAEAATKPTIALVHGAFENAEVWKGVTAQLKADGYTVIAPNLPGRPGNPESPEKVTLDQYRDTVIKAIDKSKSPVVLVGHSFGGIVISDVAEAAPKKIRTLVYVAAYLPKDGESLLVLAQADTDSKVGPHLTIDKEHGIASIERSARADLFAADASEAVRKAIPDQIVDEPLAPLATPVKLTPAAFGSVDKVYVHTTLDNVVSPSLQARMVAATPVRSETSLKTGHTPFITDIKGLTKAIEAAASSK
jgi:pimeloyl-ACP methyl ester carboxylesterase